MKKLLAALLPLGFAAFGSAQDWTYTTLNPTLPPDYYVLQLAGINDQGHAAFLASDVNRTQDLIIVLDEKGRQTVTPVSAPYHVILGGIAADDLVGGLLFSNTSNSFFLIKKNSLQTIATPGFGFGMGGLNDHGDFTIGSHGSRGAPQVGYYTKGKFNQLTVPGETTYLLTGISNDDTMVGALPDSGRTFLFKNGKFTFIPIVQNADAAPQAISDNGQYVAGFCENHGAAGLDLIFGFIRNHHGDVDVIEYPQAPTFTPSGGAAEPLARSQTYIWGVNDRGQVCGFALGQYLTPAGGFDQVSTYFTAKRKAKP